MLPYAPRRDAAMALKPESEPLEPCRQRRLDRNKLQRGDPSRRDEMPQEAAQLAVAGLGAPLPAAAEQSRDRADEFPVQMLREDIRCQIAKPNARQMQPDDETGACEPERADAVGPCSRSSRNPARNASSRRRLAFQFAGGVDVPRILEETNEPHEFGRRPPSVPAFEANGRTGCTATAIVLQETVDDRAVDRSQFNAGEIEPDQEVTGYAPVVVEPTLRDLSLALTPKVVDEGKGEAVEIGLKRSAQGGGTWTLQALRALRLLKWETHSARDRGKINAE